MSYRSWTMLVMVVLVAALGTGMTAPRPAQANDAAAIIAGAAVGYLVYKALDNDDGRRSSYRSNPYPNYNPPRGGYYGYGGGSSSPRQTYNRGYRDGWTDGERYGENRGYRNGWNSGYRTGYSDASWGYGGSHYNPPSTRGGGWRY